MRFIVLILLWTGGIGCLLPARADENRLRTGPASGESVEECAEACHKRPHPVTGLDLNHPSGQCLLCHNHGDVPDEIVRAGMSSLKPQHGLQKAELRQKQGPMVTIPAGEFVMGEDHFKKAVSPRHHVYVDSYEIDRYDVTNGDYFEFVSKTGRKAPKHWADPNVLKVKRDHPVTWVSWNDAEAYCEWKGKKLPTEIEWERAARGEDGRVFPWGNEFVKEYANVYILGIGDTTPVGAFEKGKSPYGIYDMAGNVFQWVYDWFKPYPGNSAENPNYGETHKVLRGGSFYDCSYYRCGPSFQSFNRIAMVPQSTAISIGFRCARPHTKDKT